MANLFFHSEAINERGTAAALFEYASLCKSRGHEVTWGFNEGNHNDKRMISLAKQKFNVLPITNFKSFSKSASRDFDWAYFLKKGHLDDFLIPGIPNGVHVIFQYYQPHGEKYAYISEWLARHMAREQLSFLPRKLRKISPLFSQRFEYVPFSVNLPRTNLSLRTAFNIPNEARVCLRFGGYETFDIDWVKKTVIEVLERDQSFWFLGVNTERFTSHERAIFCPPIYGMNEKAQLLNSCDFVLHGRRQGESFGMTILESMQANKPILSWYGGWDRNHAALLNRSSFYYGPYDLKKRLLDYGRKCDVERNSRIAEEFRPEKIFHKFNSVFGFGII